GGSWPANASHGPFRITVRAVVGAWVAGLLFLSLVGYVHDKQERRNLDVATAVLDTSVGTLSALFGDRKPQELLLDAFPATFRTAQAIADTNGIWVFARKAQDAANQVALAAARAAIAATELEPR